MAVLIPARGSCASRMTPGERRLAERLEDKLDADYLLWYDVPVGPRQIHPDFIVLHPSRGLLILEVKDWRLDTIRQADRDTWLIAPGGELKSVANPFAQARHHAHEVIDALSRDRQLVHADGPYRGKPAFPWTYGVVFTHITRRQFQAAELHRAIEAHRVICADEMTDSVEPESFQSRLWEMFPYLMGRPLSLPQIDRVRWILFPQVRIPEQAGLFDEHPAEAEVPDIVRVMDLQQEQLARSLGDGHRVVHGVAGSGKTMILGYRAELLARTHADGKPILVLCYNEPLAVRLAATMKARGLSERVVVVHFHKWCRDQLVAYGQTLPAPNLPVESKMADMVDRVIRGVERGHIPTGQYHAVMIDEGHDFAPEWFKLVVQMVDPATQSLLVLYDDAQSIYARQRAGRRFSFKSVGIQAQGRTAILKVNYRNTRQILQTASAAAAELLAPEPPAVTPPDGDDDHVPHVQPVSCGRDGPAPLVIDLPTLAQRAQRLADWLASSHESGQAWGDMAVLCRDWRALDACEAALRRRSLPHAVRRKTGQYQPLSDRIHVMTMHASKGLEFPVVALLGDRRMGDTLTPEDVREEGRLVYVAATRATHQLALALGAGVG
jgi:hypothetical protein